MKRIRPCEGHTLFILDSGEPEFPSDSGTFASMKETEFVNQPRYSREWTLICGEPTLVAPHPPKGTHILISRLLNPASPTYFHHKCSYKLGILGRRMNSQGSQNGMLRPPTIVFPVYQPRTVQIMRCILHSRVKFQLLQAMGSMRSQSKTTAMGITKYGASTELMGTTRHRWLQEEMSDSVLF